MDIHEIELGSVTYEIQRAYKGDRPAAELILDRLTKEQATSSFDKKTDPVVQ